jgi:glycine betaine/proline transport system substrate-binding protein
MRKAKQQQTWKKGLAAIAAGLTLSLGSATAAVPESQDPLTLTLNDWASQKINAHIAGKVLEKMGYNVEYQAADYIAQVTGIKSGDLTVAMEMWETTAREKFLNAVDSGKAVDLGSIGVRAIEEWWYPAYMEEKCPGLPDWKALRECGKEFAAPQTMPKGRYLGGPVTWAGKDEERVKALDLPFDVVHAGTNAALMAEIQSAIQTKRPIIAWVYQPHWLPAKYDGKWIEFPEYTEACYNDASWGPNPDMKYDCGKPRGWIKALGWAGGEDKWPAAYAMIENYDLSTQTVGELAGKVGLEDWSVEKTAQWWIDNNKAVWQQWIDDAKASTGN